MPDRFPGYDVLSKRNTPSWNEKTRQVIDARLAVPREPRFFTEQEYATLIALADRITPQPRNRAPILLHRWSTRSCMRTSRTASVLLKCPGNGRPGAVVYGRSTRKHARRSEAPSAN